MLHLLFGLFLKSPKAFSVSLLNQHKLSHYHAFARKIFTSNKIQCQSKTEVSRTSFMWTFSLNNSLCNYEKKCYAAFICSIISINIGFNGTIEKASRASAESRKQPQDSPVESQTADFLQVFWFGG